jgi:hypothetical protein
MITSSAMSALSRYSWMAGPKILYVDDLDEAKAGWTARQKGLSQFFSLPGLCETLQQEVMQTGHTNRAEIHHAAIYLKIIHKDAAPNKKGIAVTTTEHTVAAINSAPEETEDF